MSLATPVAILGFTPFERSTFEAFLKLAARRAPAYRMAGDPFEADFVIVDADDPALVQRVQSAGLLPRSVLLGAAVGQAGAARHLARPFKPTQVLRVLDTLPRPLRLRPADDELTALPAAVPAAGRVAAAGSSGPWSGIRIPVPAGPPSLGPAAAGLPGAGPPVVRVPDLG